MFQAGPCSSSGGPILLLQHLVLSLSVDGCIVRQLRAVCSQLAYYTTIYREWQYQML